MKRRIPVSAVVALLIVIVVVAAVAVHCAACATLPTGTAGADADAVAHKAEEWVNKEAWDKTNALKFRYREATTLLWDKERGFVEVKKGDNDVFIDLWDRGGFASKNGVDVSDDAATKNMISDAWALYCNDTFWLNPIVKLFDAGTTRELVEIDGKRALKITYGAGGVTPGDAYVWTVDDEGKPLTVRMWVSVLPIKGIGFSWDGWVTLPSGARVSTSHASAGVEHAVELQDVVGADTAAAANGDANGPDPFARLVGRRAKEHAGAH